MINIENKSMGFDLKQAFHEFNRTFHEFKEANEERLKQLEKRSYSDPLVEEKLSRLNYQLDQVAKAYDVSLLESNRPKLPGAEQKNTYEEKGVYPTAFHTYIRCGETNGLKAKEEKSMSVGSGPDGGYLVPLSLEREVMRRLPEISPLRSIASIREISGSGFRKAFSFMGPASGWVSETDPRPQTENQKIVDLSFPAMEVYALPTATQTLLDDAAIDIETWLVEEIQVAFAEQEGAAFVKGDGVKKPMGFLTYPKVPQAQWSWGHIGYNVTGLSGALPDQNPSDILLDLIYSLRTGYRQNAKFVMNRHTQAALRKIKTTTGDYLWFPPSQMGAQATFMNFPIVEAEDMPDIAPDSYAIAFGDFKRGYLIVDRLGLRILRDPYSSKPYVLFYTTKRVGGGVQDFEALKLLKFGTA